MNIPSKHMLLVILILSGVCLPPAAGQEFQNPKVRPPQAKPQRRAAAESLPPLPLPATPLRRTERKRQPAPPALVGLIQFQPRRFKVVDGNRRPVGRFPTTQVDLERLMAFANKKLDIRYRYLPTTLGKFSWNPTELPVLYITGWTPLPELPDDLLEKLRRYLYDGGTLVLHAQCGRDEFHASARKAIARMLPDRELVLVEQDSPLYSAFFRIREMRFRKDDGAVKKTVPLLEAVYLGCRPAVVLSAVDLNCTWDIEHRPIMGGTLYHRDDGLSLGVNILTTALANFQYARAWSVQRTYPQQDKPNRDELVLAQVFHGGDWDPTPHALVNLMKYIQSDTTLNVQFKRKILKLTDESLYEHPVLYMTGLRDFKFTDTEVRRLRTYLAGGGFLLADAAAGREAFDTAFRREIARVLPDSKLQPLPRDSSVYDMPYEIQTVDYTEIVKARQPRLNTPTLEGIGVNGRTAVIYSPLGLSCGWEQLGFAFNRGYSDADALRLGVNLLTFAMTH